MPGVHLSPSPTSTGVAGLAGDRSLFLLLFRALLIIRGIKREDRPERGVIGIEAVSGIVDVAVFGKVAVEAFGGNVSTADRSVGVCELLDLNECDRENRFNDRTLVAIDGTFAVEGELCPTSDVGLLIMMDHRRRRLAALLELLLRPIEFVPSTGGRDKISSDGLDGGLEGARMIGSCGRIVPMGGRSGMRLSIRACARLI